MTIDTWLEVITILMWLMAFIVTFFPAITRLRKISYVVIIISMGVGHFHFERRRSNELQTERIAALKDREMLQKQIRVVQDQNRAIQEQNRDRDAQYTAERTGVPPTYERSNSLGVQTGLGVEATVEKGARHGAEEGR